MAQVFNNREVELGGATKKKEEYIPEDYISDIEANRERFGHTYVTLDQTLSKFNVSRLPDYENAAEPYFGFIFMSRPSLNVLVPSLHGYSGRSGIPTAINPTGEATANYDALQSSDITAILVNDPVGSMMLDSLSMYSNYGAWLPNITNKAMSYQVNDIRLKSVEKGNTYFGHMIKYGKHSEEHKIGSTITLDFRNDRYLSVLKQMLIWRNYIHIISKSSTISPRPEYEQTGVLDYCGSIYYIVTRRDMREIVYWEKIVGVYPSSIPLSIFNYSDNLILEDKISIDFETGIRSDPYDPGVLLDFNMLSGLNYNSIKSRFAWKGMKYGIPMGGTYGDKATASLYAAKIIDSANGSPIVAGDVFADYPIVSAVKDNKGMIKYYLDWENRGSSTANNYSTSVDESWAIQAEEGKSWIQKLADKIGDVAKSKLSW